MKSDDDSGPVDRRRSDAIAIALLIGLATAVFADVLFLRANFWFRDLPTYFYPIKELVRAAWLSGEFPFWTRAWSAGQPVAANPAFEIFYPPQLLLLLPDFDLGYRLHLFLHILIGLGGMYLLLRSLKTSPSVAAAGAIAFGLGGPFLSTICITSTFFGVAWWPWIAWSFRRYILSGRLRDLGIASIMIGLELLVCEPTSMLEIALILIGYVISQLLQFRADRHRVRQIVARSILAATFGFLIGAAQLVPAIEHAGDTVRAEGYPLVEATRWSTPAARWLELVAPRFDGSYSGLRPEFWGARLYPTKGEPFILSFYVGIAAAILLITGIVLRIRGWGLALSLIVVGFVLSLGCYSPLAQLLFDVGLFRKLRYPEKFSLLVAFVIVVFSSLVLERLVEGDKRAIRFAITIAGSVTTLLLASYLVVGDPGRFAAIWHLPSLVVPLFSAAYRHETLEAVARAAAIGVIFWLLGRRGRVAAPLIVLFVAIDVVPLADQLLFRVGPEFYSQPPAAARLVSSRGGRLFDRTELHIVPKFLNNQFAVGEAVAWFVRNGLLPRTATTWGIPTVLELDFDGTTLRPTTELDTAMMMMLDQHVVGWEAKVAAMSNVSAMTTLRPVFIQDVMTPERFRQVQPVDVVNTDVAPRYYFANRVVTIGSVEDFIREVASPAWTPQSAAVGGGHPPSGKARILGVSESNNRASIDFDAETPALLVASVTAHRWWRAEVDGRPVALHRVNLAYQGAVVPAGRHRFVMTYLNPWVVWFAVLSALALFGALFLVVAGGKGRQIVVNEETSK